MKKVINNGIDIIANCLQYALAIDDVIEIGELIKISLAIICSLIIILPKLINWFKKAIADGKITKEEMEEGISIIKNESDEKSRKE